ncbi:flagellar hook-length control protein FliK [Neorhizobium sp. T786]|uniref:flagellar hook-length control protein FliK n=1 Tax=Pseudorhizobium xiangyangii TaxID=2883104 RepID=UPI001D0003E4|nr:flagellar hook-length control protein FliK [Neorhizobium xiangyangii]MCB5202662.1 flagellar hook-length control protein FliK [Neorhizobium xiangyangii]
MMLDALSNPTPTELAIKNGGRSGKGSDGSSDFSGTLSKLGKENGASGSGTQAQSGAGGEPESSEIDGETGGKARMRGPNFLISGNRLDGIAPGSKRVSIDQALSANKGAASQASLFDMKIKSITDRMSSGEAEGAVEDPDVASEEGVAVEGESQGASDLLTMLANPMQQAWTAGASSQRAASTVDGRKAESGQGRGREASAVEAALSQSDASEMLDMPTAEADPEQQQRLLRFVGGKDSSLNSELNQAANGSDRSTEGKTNVAENVTVLDSRRYLGLAPNSNGASLVASMVGDSEWSSAMQSGALAGEPANGGATGSVVNTLKLLMNPHNLGSVTATLRLIGEELRVHLTVETRAAYRQLSEDSSGMLDALKSQGFSVDQVTINIASSSDTDQQKGQQGAQTGQQMAGNGERNGAANNKEQSGAQFATELNGGVDELGSSDAPAADPVGSRAGQLYL